LQRFGYFPNVHLESFRNWQPAMPAPPADMAVFDDTTEAALRMFQQMHGLPADGTLNRPT
jgi:murein L,D-transpeptidase YcbB/YkuD